MWSLKLPVYFPTDPNTHSEGDYTLLAILPVFFFLGLGGVVVCHVLKKKGYRCTTETQDADEAVFEEEKDPELGGGMMIRIKQESWSHWIKTHSCWNKIVTLWENLSLTDWLSVTIMIICSSKYTQLFSLRRSSPLYTTHPESLFSQVPMTPFWWRTD